MSVACRSWLRRARSYRILVDPVPELARTGRVPEEVERSRPETVARPDRLQPTYQTVLEEIRGRCRIAAEVFVAGARGRPRGASPQKGTAIMKLTTTTQVSVDGVMQGNGGRHPRTYEVFELAGNTAETAYLTRRRDQRG